MTFALISCQKTAVKKQAKIDEIEFSYSSGLRIPHNKVLINISRSYSKDSAVVLVISKPLFDTPQWKNSEINKKLRIDMPTFEKLAEATQSFEKINMDKAHAIGNDGSTWKIEFGSKGKNKSYSFWSPNSDSKKRGLTEFVNLCEQIVVISNLNKEEILGDYLQ